MSVVRHVGSDIKAVAQNLATKQGAYNAARGAKPVLKHVAKEVGKMALKPFKAVKNVYKLATSGAARKQFVKQFTHVVKTETKETVQMCGTIHKLVKGKHVTREEKIAAANQALDLIKITAKTAIVAGWGAWRHRRPVDRDGKGLLRCPEEMMCRNPLWTDPCAS